MTSARPGSGWPPFTPGNPDVWTSRRQIGTTKAIQKRATIYLDSELHRVLKLKAVESDRAISDLLNEAVRLQLAEEAGDLSSFKDRVRKPNPRFEDVPGDLKQRARI